MNWPGERALAICRIALGFAVILNTAELTVTLLRLRDGAVHMPGVLPLPMAHTAIEVWMTLSMSAGALIALGAFTKAASLIASASCLAVMLWDQQVYTNHHWLTTLLVAMLAFSRSDAAWSVRARFRGPDTAAATPVLLMMTQLSICYLFAGLSKINPWWLAGDELVRSLRFPLPDVLYTLMALLVVGVEVFMALGFWFRRTRTLALLSGVGLHVSIALLMHDRAPLVTFGILCLSLYPVIRTAPYVSDLIRRSDSPEVSKRT